MNQASKFIPCCFFHFLMCSRIIKYIYFIPNFAVPFWGLMDIMSNFTLSLRISVDKLYHSLSSQFLKRLSSTFLQTC